MRRERGGICILSVGLALLFLAGCATNPLPVKRELRLVPDVEYPELPLQRTFHASQAPIVDLDGILHVGADAAVPADQVPPVTHHGDTALSYGLARDGVGAAEVIAYLQAGRGRLPEYRGRGQGGRPALPRRFVRALRGPAPDRSRCPRHRCGTGR